MLVFISIQAFAQDGPREVGNVVYPVFGKTKKHCAQLFGAGHSTVRVHEPHAHKLYESVLKAIDDVDPARVHMHLDFTSQIWAWEPLDRPGQMRIRFGRDERGRAVRAFVERGNYPQTLIMTSPERVQELEDELRRRLPVATVTIVDDLDELYSRPWPTAGLLL